MRRTVFLIPLVLLGLVLFPSLVVAQTSTTAVPITFTFLLLPATGDPLTMEPLQTQTTTIGPTQNCGLDPTTLPPAATGTPVNPLIFMLDDPFTAGRKCRLGFPTGLQAGTYQWAGIFNALCQPETGGPVPCTSPRAVGTPNFSVVNLKTPPAAPSGLTALSR